VSEAGQSWAGSRLAADLISSAQAQRVREAALTLLERDGVFVPGQSAQALFAQAGAKLDSARGVAYLSPSLIERTLASLPDRVVLGARSAADEVTLDGVKCRLATGGPAHEVRELDGQRRAATAGDLAAACRLADALPEIALISGPPLPALDLPERGRALAELEICLTNSSKHVQLHTVRTVGEARALIAIGEALAGSPEAMRARPPLSLAAPAAHELDEVRLDALLTAAAAGLPVSFSLAVNGESGVLSADAGLSPLERALAENQARALAAAALVQLAAPGAPFVALLPLQPLPETALHLSGESGRGGQSDAEVQARPAATLDGYPLALAYNQLKGAWALPLMGRGSWSAAVVSGWEASVASSVATLAASLGGVDLLAGAGLLEGGTVFSPQQLVLDCESQAVSARIAQGIEVSEETIALETIEAVGIGGNALGQRHTRTHMRDVWRPRLFDRSAYEAWLREGKAGSEDKATELAAHLLTTHEVPPLEAEKTATVRRIIATAGL